MTRDAYAEALQTLSSLFDKKKAHDLKNKGKKPPAKGGEAVSDIVSKTVGAAVNASNGAPKK